MAGGPQRRIATVDCAVANRFTIPFPLLKRLSALASIKCQMRSLDRKNASTIHVANSLLGTFGTLR
jgi:hypothetical protein